MLRVSRLERSEDEITFYLVGEVDPRDVAGCASVAGSIFAHLATNPAKFCVLDLSGITLVSGEGDGQLLNFVRIADDLGIAMRVQNAPKNDKIR